MPIGNDIHRRGGWQQIVLLRVYIRPTFQLILLLRPIKKVYFIVIRMDLGTISHCSQPCHLLCDYDSLTQVMRVRDGDSSSVARLVSGIVYYGRMDLYFSHWTTYYGGGRKCNWDFWDDSISIGLELTGMVKSKFNTLVHRILALLRITKMGHVELDHEKLSQIGFLQQRPPEWHVLAWPSIQRRIFKAAPEWDRPRVWCALDFRWWHSLDPAIDEEQVVVF